MHNYSPDLYNLQTRKKSEMVQTVQMDFSINNKITRFQIKLKIELLDISVICYMIQGLNSHNLLTDKVAENVA